MTVPALAFAPSRRMRLGLAVLVADAAILLTLFAIGWRGVSLDDAQDRAGRTGASPTIATLRERLAQERPRVVFVGDSLVGEGVDPALFTEKTGVRSAKMVNPGAATAYWYLLVKNVLAAAPEPERPRTVVLCFRDIHLTQPSRNATGKYAERIGELAAGPEPLVDRLAYHASDRPLEQALLRAARVYAHRGLLVDNLHSWIKAGVAALCRAPDRDAPDAAIARVFDYRLMNAELATRRQRLDESQKTRRDTTFDAAVAQSFLPHILAVCREAGMRLILVNMKRRPEALALDPGEQDEQARRAYLRSLRAWLDAEKVPLLDFSGDERLTLPLYADGDHLNRTEGRPLFTTLLADALAPLLSPEAGP